ncbi:uncharacterized protein PHALS_14605 [Plasmopara halstedii]|uniref:Uncharacterized protein n=1 Tax=Plasmopara halstedii TaxID=4781 RepID=A0A0P1ALH0_PLAHL|nr:uncharacterized protein PHALS_14605 [Plasmopara halstedii]CEG42255.1 hypothetical protein PHALS_14605 [Plasmopara halstedii]|eukprot:XP_024578624.1 hypothetical protein PHALS_14605 [Plasmopara halstedii]
MYHWDRGTDPTKMIFICFMPVNNLYSRHSKPRFKVSLMPKSNDLFFKLSLLASVVSAFSFPYFA